MWLLMVCVSQVGGGGEWNICRGGANIPSRPPPLNAALQAAHRLNTTQARGCDHATITVLYMTLLQLGPLFSSTCNLRRTQPANSIHIKLQKCIGLSS